MKYLRIFALLVALNTGAWIMPQEASAQQGGVSFGIFYNELSPYGEWVDYPGYGYVWIPSTGPDFAPYYNDGHWILTDYGWTWVSDYPWGWAPFHYGRWDYDDYYGWFWVPDNEWGPAWVSWRRSPGYYGWAPLRPGISISIAFGREYHERNERWIFVRERDFSRDDIHHYYMNRNNNNRIIKNSSVINRTYTDQNRHSTYVSGPDRADVQKRTGKTIQPVVVHDNDRPGQNLRNGQLKIYRPQVQMNDENGRRPAPSRVVNLKDVKRPSERNAANRQQQPRTVNPPNKSQPQQPRNVNPSGSKGKVKQPQNVAPPNKSQPQQPRNVNPSNSGVKEKQSQNVAPPGKSQPQQPQTVSPFNSRGKGKQPQTVNPSSSKRKENQPQNVAPPNKNRKAQPSQPKTNQDEKEKGKR